MVSPQNFMPRKRKQRSAASCPSPNPFTGRSTRSKTQSLLHRSRSGLAWPGRNPFTQRSHLQINNLLENPRKTQQMLDGIEASSPYVSVEKKCSGRGRTQLRVSTILLSNGVVREKESDGFKFQQYLGEKKSWSSGMESEVHLVPRFESLNSGLSESDKEQVKNNEDSVPVSKDSDIGGLVVGCAEQLDKDERSIDDKNSFCLDKRSASKSGNRLGKVFKAPASFNYRRLLPFLTEMAKTDSSTLCNNAKNVEILESSLPSSLGYAKGNSDSDMHLDERNSKNSGSQHSVEVLDMEDPLNSSTRTGGLEDLDIDMQLDCKNYQDSGFQHVEEHDLEDPLKSSAQTGGQENSDRDMQLEGQNSQYSGFQLPIEGCDSEEPSNNSALTEAQNQVFTTDQANNPSNEILNLTECVQTTPPDLAILSKFDIGHRTLGKRNTQYTEIQHIGLKPTNTSINEYVNDTVDSQRSPIQKSNSSPKTKPTSSISYRRLLPYLMDVAKGTSRIDQQPLMLENGLSRSSESLSSPSYEDDLSVNRKGQNDLHEKFDVGNEVSNAFLIADASSPEFNTGNLDPLASSDSLSTVEIIATSEAITVEPDKQICVQLDLTVNEESATAKTDLQVPPSLPETVIQHKKRTLKSSQVNCSKDTSISSTKSELQPVEPITDVLQIQSENGCRLMELAPLNNSPVPENSIQNHSPLTGILKRNPRGCRGLCNCLNCSSFRLHAERSFEFSRNQLLDAEEVAFGLIEELTTLRSLLEKNVDNGCDVAAFKCDQVKEASKKALIREKVAKQRLTLLNEELIVHCRHTPLLRPSVTFSERIEERAISRTNKFKNNTKE